MTAEIISGMIELLLGNILNTNAQYLSRAGRSLSIPSPAGRAPSATTMAVWPISSTGQEPLRLAGLYHGGLGPTADDLTKETVAACFGDELAFDEAEWDKITSYFARRPRGDPNNRKQAMVPARAIKIINNHGTAPGAWFEQDGRCAVLMPGVPHEMKAMWTESVRPLLMSARTAPIHSVTLRVLGGENDIIMVRDLLEKSRSTAAICKTGECEIRITAALRRGRRKKYAAYAKKFCHDMLGDAVYDENVAGLEETVVHTLQEKGLTIATAELHRWTHCTAPDIRVRLGRCSAMDSSPTGSRRGKLVGVDPAVIETTTSCPPRGGTDGSGRGKRLQAADIAVSTSPAWPGPTGGDEVRPLSAAVYLGAARDGVAYVEAFRLPA